MTTVTQHSHNPCDVCAQLQQANTAWGDYCKQLSQENQNLQIQAFAMMSMMNTPTVQPTVNNHNRNEEIPSLNERYKALMEAVQHQQSEKRVLITQLEKYSTDAETLEEQITEVQRKLVETENLLDTTQKQITSAEENQQNLDALINQETETRQRIIEEYRISSDKDSVTAKTIRVILAGKAELLYIERSLNTAANSWEEFYHALSNEPVDDPQQVLGSSVETSLSLVQAAESTPAIVNAVSIAQQYKEVVPSESRELLEQFNYVCGFAKGLTNSLKAVKLQDCPVCTATYFVDKQMLNMTFGQKCDYKTCITCLKEKIKVAITDKNSFPLKCDSCKDIIDLEVIIGVMSTPDFTPEDIQKVRDWTTQACMADEAIVECPVCSTPYNVAKVLAEKPIELCRNPDCQQQFCLRCKVLWHEGMTCKQYQDEHSPEAKATKEWIAANTKICPKCNWPIERSEGCNHMHCKHCNGHFCWVCMALFASSGETYQHMNQEKHW